MTFARIVDISPLERLLHLAGATGAFALLSAMLDDLKSTEANLDQAWNGPDFDALRTNSHVLVALAGTIGDTDLHAIAQGLNAAAQTQNLGSIMDMKPKIMTGLSDLITLLAQQKTSSGT